MKTYLSFLFMLIFSLPTFSQESIHRLGGYYENNGKKYAVCISLFENVWFSRGVKAFNGYMTFATDYFGDVPMSPPGFNISGNLIPDSGKFIFAVFDQNNTSSTNPDLMLRPTDMELKGDSLTTLSLIQNGKTFAFIIKELNEKEECLMSRPK